MDIPFAVTVPTHAYGRSRLLTGVVEIRGHGKSWELGPVWEQYGSYFRRASRDTEARVHYVLKCGPNWDALRERWLQSLEREDDVKGLIK